MATRPIQQNLSASAAATSAPLPLSGEYHNVYCSARTSPTSTEARERTIRCEVKRWFGPLDVVEPSARQREAARQEKLQRTILRLHQISCNYVPEQQRIPLPEGDVEQAIVALNRLAVTLGCHAESVIAFCEIRASREKSTRANQLDPFQLRHVLTYHSDIPHEELNSGEIALLKTACALADRKKIHAWFETIDSKQNRLPKDASQFLRHLVMELWRPSERDFLESFASELAVFDVIRHDAIGWENSRLFISIFKRIHGSSCRGAAAFLDDIDLETALEAFQRLEDHDESLFFRGAITAHNPDTVKRLKRTIAAAAAERLTRLAATPFAKASQHVVARESSTPGFSTSFARDAYANSR